MRKHGISGARQEVDRLIFSLKSKISVATVRMQRYNIQEKSKNQNQAFIKNCKQFYRDIAAEGDIKVKEIPSEDELRNFWGGQIWGQSNLYDPSAEWIPAWKDHYKAIKEQSWVDVSYTDLTSQLNKTMNWKAPGLDLVPNYWLKNLNVLQQPLACALNECVTNPESTPQWLVTGKSTLLPKNEKTVAAKNYRPITCLSTTFKALTGIIATRIERHLNENNILADEQGARRACYGTKQQLLINKTLLEHSIKARRNLSVTYYDYAKAYDSVPHEWIIETLTTYKICPVIIGFLKWVMPMWSTKLVLRHENGILEVKNIRICRGIFQGDSLSPLLFVLAINPVSYLLDKGNFGYKIDDVRFNHVLYMDDLKTFAGNSKEASSMAKVVYDFSTSIGMKFGFDKCKVLNIVRGKIKKCGNIDLDKDNSIEEMESGEVYKYLGVLESNNIKHSEMKGVTTEKFKKKLKQVLKTELNSKNVMTAINEYVTPVITYTFGVVNWTEQDIKEIDIHVRKSLNMNKMFEIKSDIDRLYTTRKMGGRGLISVWDCFKCTNIRLAHFLRGTKNEKLLKCAEFDKACLFSITKRAEKYTENLYLELPKNINEKPLLRQAQVMSEAAKGALQKLRHKACLEKPQHGNYFKLLEEKFVSKNLSLSWLEKVHISPQSEAYLFAAQELALFTRWHERHILKKTSDDKCRICKAKPETMSHILSGCDNLAKKEYLDRHNGVAQYVHHSICNNFGVQTNAKWHTHKPQEVLVLKNVEIIWDTPLSTDRPYVFNRPDIVVRDKANKKCFIIDISCPNDINVAQKEQEKISKYSGLRIELGRMWDCECMVIPIVVGSLGVVSLDFDKYRNMIPAKISSTMCIKIALLGSEKILRAFLSRK